MHSARQVHRLYFQVLAKIGKPEVGKGRPEMRLEVNISKTAPNDLLQIR